MKCAGFTMCAVVYIIAQKGESSKSNIPIAKTKVAPVKSQAIPRLELYSLLSLLKLVESTCSALNFRDVSVHLWSVSTVALAWVQSQTHLWLPFISHRIAEIQCLVPQAQYHHIEGNFNPGDLGTRGLSIESLINSNLCLYDLPISHEYLFMFQ